MHRFLLLAVLLSACATVPGGIPRPALDHCEREAYTLLDKYANGRGIILDSTVRTCAHMRLVQDCADAMSRYAHTRRNPEDKWFWRFAGGEWDQEAHDDAQEQRQRAFDQCGNASERAQALKVFQGILGAHQGRIDWPERGEKTEQKILKALGRKPKSPIHIAARAGVSSQYAMARLARLAASGRVERVKVSRSIHYKLPSGPQAVGGGPG